MPATDDPVVRLQLVDVAQRLRLLIETWVDLVPHWVVTPSPPGGAEVEPSEQEASPPSWAAPAPGPGLVVQSEGAMTLDGLRQEAERCKRCSLAATRTTVVFGEGPVGPKVMFVGEGPGEQEDLAGRPFVGPAGQLLDRMIAAMGLKREECYIANVVKCRPPGNATPTPEWVRACGPYLRRQIELVAPRILVALGGVAANFLTGQPLGVVRQRGRVHRHGDIPLVVTYHPAALLRDPGLKRLAWEDLKMVMARL